MLRQRLSEAFTRRAAGAGLWWGAAALSMMLLRDPAKSFAADHNDPIHVQATYQSGELSGYVVNTGDPAADIADLFAWYSGPPGQAKSLIMALTWRLTNVQSSTVTPVGLSR